MNLKTYQAKTMADALAGVKRDLGRDAVILHTRSFRKGGFLGLGGKRWWEITASPNVNVPSRADRGRYVRAPEPELSGDDAALDEPLGDSGGKAAIALAGGPSAAIAVAEPRGFLSQQMADLRRMVESLIARQAPAGENDMPVELVEFQVHLIAQDVGEELVADLMRQLRMTLTGQQLSDRINIRGKLEELLIAQIPVAPPTTESEPGRGKVIALIGPTGVGKTTTIAKLAANYKLRQGKRVGLVTIDTYRIAAVDQLRTYAEIIDVPLQTVLTAGELHQTVRSMRDLDVVLIDTAGRSQNDRLRLNQLRSFLSAAEPDEVHLVVSSTANRRCATSTLERFIPLGANRIIMTKLDEAATFGSILNVASAGKVPFSYVTAGQDVPEDITPADPHRLASWVLDGSLEVSNAH